VILALYVRPAWRSACPSCLTGRRLTHRTSH